MRFPQRALAFQVPGDIQDGFDFLFREVQVADKIATSEVGLHSNAPLFIILYFKRWSSHRPSRPQPEILVSRRMADLELPSPQMLGCSASERITSTLSIFHPPQT